MWTKQSLIYLTDLIRRLHRFQQFGRNIQVIECIPKDG
ncbi:hypothetical protein Gotur_024134 [Gossypium turneri]